MIYDLFDICDLFGEFEYYLFDLFGVNYGGCQIYIFYYWELCYYDTNTEREFFNLFYFETY